MAPFRIDRLKDEGGAVVVLFALLLIVFLSAAALAVDIAARLGTLGYVRGLRRMSLDPFDDLPMYTMEQLELLQPPARDAVLLQPDRAFLDLPRVELATLAVEGLLQGRTVPALRPAPPGELRAYDGQGRFLGLVQGESDGRVRPVRLFVDVAAPP